MQINNIQTKAQKNSWLVQRNNGQDFTISCTEVSAMPSSDSVSQEKKNQIALAFERQLNEQLFASGAITKEMYEAAKASLEQSAAETESEI
ncbi:MAG: hypothetical protein LKJ90_06800 [Faecalibacterium sp.]|jgi:elongation factor P hydroxylase|nr:hypothetical protein [Faecalibacterium sp.]